MTFLLLFLVGFACSSSSPCQQYQYDLQRTAHRPPVVFLGCTSKEVKPGCCPPDCQFLLSNLDYSKVRCEDDRNCPPGYKCCRDPCVLAHRICRPSLANWYNKQCADQP